MTKKPDSQTGPQDEKESREPTLQEEIADAQLRLLHLIIKHVLKKASDEAPDGSWDTTCRR